MLFRFRYDNAKGLLAGQVEPNLALRFATRAVKMALDLSLPAREHPMCPAGKQYSFYFHINDKSFIDQACSIKMVEY